MKKATREAAIGWTEQDDIELSDEALAHEDLTTSTYVGCCDTNFHVIEPEEVFQQFLSALHEPKNK